MLFKQASNGARLSIRTLRALIRNSKSTNLPQGNVPEGNKVFFLLKSCYLAFFVNSAVSIIKANEQKVTSY